MNPTELLARIVETAKETKQDLCEEHGGPADGMPILLGLDTAETPFMLPDVLDGHPTDNLGVILNLLANKLNEKNGTMKWQWLAYIVEGYLNDASSEDELENHERGDYERDYKNNPASTVKEGIIVSLFTWEGESACTTIVYHYGDDGMPVWENTIEGDESPQGLVPEIFGQFRAYCYHEGNLEELLGMMN